MDTRRRILCTLAVPFKVEVVTLRTLSVKFETWIHGGPLDGEYFTSETVLGAMLLHKHAVELARQAVELVEV